MIKKFTYVPEYTPYDAKDPEVQAKILVDQANWRIEIERKLNELIRDYNKKIGIEDGT